MRVLHIITGLGMGGAENLLSGICAELSKRDIVQKVIYLMDLDVFSDTLKKAGAEVQLINEPELGAYKTVCEIKKAIREFNPDIVHTNLVRANTLGRTAALISGKPVLTTIHNMDEKGKGVESLYFSLIKLFNHFTVNYSKKVRLIAVADCCRNFSIKTDRINPKKITTMHNFMDFTNEKRSEKIQRSEIGFKESDFVVINVGRLAPQKSQIDILKAAKTLKEKGITDIKFIIMGEGELFGELINFIKENKLEDTAVMTGNQSNVYDYFDISDMFLMSSIFEGYSITVLEAFYNKIPVLSSDIMSMKEIVTDNENGILYKTNDIEDMIQKILDIRGGKYDLEKMTESAYDICISNTAERYTENLLNIYEDMIEKK